MNSMHASKHPTFGDMWQHSHLQQTWGFASLEMQQLQHSLNSSWCLVMERHLQTQTQDLSNSHTTFATLSDLFMNWRQTCSRISTTITDDMSDSVKGLSCLQKMIASMHWTYKFKTRCQQTAEHTSLLTSSWILLRLCSIQWSFLIHLMHRQSSTLSGAKNWGADHATLKLGSPELCNGTRLCVKNLYSHLIEATILTGCAKVKDVFIPRIPLIPTDLPFDFKRTQFPSHLQCPSTRHKDSPWHCGNQPAKSMFLIWTIICRMF